MIQTTDGVSVDGSVRLDGTLQEWQDAISIESSRMCYDGDGHSTWVARTPVDAYRLRCSRMRVVRLRERRGASLPSALPTSRESSRQGYECCRSAVAVGMDGVKIGHTRSNPAQRYQSR